MNIFPSIGLKSGRCFCMRQGDLASAKQYDGDPVDMALSFAAAGAEWVHVVDIDGAQSEGMLQFEIIRSIVDATPLKVQAGGGIRNAETVQRLLDAGVQRVTIGSMSTKSKSEVIGWIRRFGSQNIILAFDIQHVDNEHEVMSQGWQCGSQQLLWDVLDAYEGSGLQSIVCTDTSKHGMMSGSNHDLYRKIKEHCPNIELLAAGGIDSVEDLLSLKEAGASGAVIGMALYEKRLNLAEAIESMEEPEDRKMLSNSATKM